LVLESVRAGKKPSDWTPEQLAAFSPEFRPEMARLFQPAEGMKTREVTGGTGPEAVARALAEAGRRLTELAR
jgi:argininosuccinate lyase